jgi:hypothetical protein
MIIKLVKYNVNSRLTLYDLRNLYLIDLHDIEFFYSMSIIAENAYHT